MGNIEIILILFGSSASIIVILIIVFHWLGIRIDKCCLNKNKLYSSNCSSSKYKSNALKDSNNDRFNQIWNSERALSLISTNTVETMDNELNCDQNSTSLQYKPNLKHMVLYNSNRISLNECYLDVSFCELNDEKMSIELNYNAFEQYLELNCIESKLNISSENTHTFKYNYSYIVVWINNDTNNKQKSQIVSIQSNTIHYNAQFKWSINDIPLMKSGICILVYLVDIETKQEILFRDSFVTVGDVYRWKPTLIQIPLFDVEKRPTYSGEILLSLSYLPTAERLTAVIIEARNLILETKFPFADVFVQMSLIDSDGNTKEIYRTGVRKNTPNPIFNEYVVFKVSTKNLNNVSIKVVVYEQVNEFNDSIVGLVYVGARRKNYKGMEINEGNVVGHWQQMLRSLRRPVNMWQCLEK